MIQNIALVPRICVPDPAPMEVAYSMAVEQLRGLDVPERAQWLRVLQLELSRSRRTCSPSAGMRRQPGCTADVLGRRRP